MKRSGTSNYVYRLSAARLAILRLRILNRWNSLPVNNRLASAPVEQGNRAACWLAGFIMAIGLLSAGVLGYSLGQTADGGDGAVIGAAASMAEVLQMPETAPAPAFGNEPTAAQSSPVVEAASTAEPERLKQTVHELQARIRSLEQETTRLEVELLDQQLAFAKEEARWKEAAIERRVIYNITNIPIGGSISGQAMNIPAQAEPIEPPEANVEYQDQAVTGDPYDRYRETDGAQEQWNGDVYLADVLEQQAEEGGEVASGQEFFDGPAADRYEDLINP